MFRIHALNYCALSSELTYLQSYSYLKEEFGVAAGDTSDRKHLPRGLNPISPIHLAVRENQDPVSSLARIASRNLSSGRQKRR